MRDFTTESQKLKVESYRGLSCPPLGGGIDFVSGAVLRALQNLEWGVSTEPSPTQGSL